MKQIGELTNIWPCHCGAYCWATHFPEKGDDINVSEDYPGEYTHFCSKHGHPEDENV